MLCQRMSFCGQTNCVMNQSTQFYSVSKRENQTNKPLQELTRPHIDSFNYMLKEGLASAVKDIPPVEFALPNKQKISLTVNDATISNPKVPKANNFAKTTNTYPAECREGRKTYRGALTLRVRWSIDGIVQSTEENIVGEVPIMVKSAACNLDGLRPKKLIEKGEEAEEMGGYFIVNGNEKVMRMLIMQRRNYPTALSRLSWKNRGPLYTEYGVSMRCVKTDLTSANVVLHYLNTGGANLSFTWRKEQFFVPIILILKALVKTTDQFIYSELIKGKEEDSFYKGCIANMLREVQEEGLTNQSAIKNYIGKTFRIKTYLPEWYTNAQVTDFLLKQSVCIHLDNNIDKFNILVYMTRKLYSFANGQCANESADNPMFQEVLLPGHLYQMILKEKIETWLHGVRSYIEAESKRKSGIALSQSLMNGAINKAKGMNLTKAMEYLLATGNLVSTTGLGLLQMSGLTIIADKLNFMRYISHFRCVHRGAFFAQMRTTSVRKLLPEAWGFLCPVHTPDGPPCGLMNHMSASCQMVNVTYNTSGLPSLLSSLGMFSYVSQPPIPITQCYPVMLNGRMIGWVPDDLALNIAEQLRTMKVKALNNVPRMMEICLVPKTDVASQHPGLNLFTSTARMMRPVQNLACNSVEMIGTFEQAYMNICIIPEEAHEGLTTHQELSEYSMLSAVASLTPYSDFNQSPRNMYQCQMGKQTMGTPLHALPRRADNKLYRIQTPQSPLVRPAMYEHYNIDNYPLGTNAIVAVISYTGYDMEDAMILNKSSYERGFCHGSVYKSELINLKDMSRDRGKASLIFGKSQNDQHQDKLDEDGLPYIGRYMQQGEPYYSYINLHTGESKLIQYKSMEPAYIDQIKVCGHDHGNEHMYQICIILRIQRNPIIGDKFASRHGQKGICSLKWPVEDMPFSESGITPDILFNPHGFPSRMTIGMMIESMAGKSAAMHGLCHDATPFTFSEKEPAIDYFGRMLTSAGYNYYGTERMYSGIDGCEFEADIFMGVVYYQRLRHMVSDKFQVRTTGPVDQVSRQPVQGRKRGGGVRFGEMERDALLAHGTSFLLHDRLLNCSDESKAFVCTECGSLLSPLIERPVSVDAASSYESKRDWICRTCGVSANVKLIRVPFVFKYLVAELAAMNIKSTLDIRET